MSTYRGTLVVQLDADTCEVLAFVARRVDMEPIVVLFAVRDGHHSRLEEACLPEVRLEGLDDADSARLLDAHARELAPDTRCRLLETARGNPLALLELPHAAASEHVSGSPIVTTVPITDQARERHLGTRRGAARTD